MKKKKLLHCGSQLTIIKYNVSGRALLAPVHYVAGPEAKLEWLNGIPVRTRKNKMEEEEEEHASWVSAERTTWVKWPTDMGRRSLTCSTGKII